MNSHKTAIKRKSPSRPVLELVNSGLIKGKVLDYGCGKGKDSDFLREMRFDVVSYDIFFNPITIQGKFDTIICNYVLNVIDNHLDRVKLVNKMMKHLKNDGTLFISTRTKKEINKYGVKWKNYNDGFLTKSNTFQKGIDWKYFISILERCNMKIFCVDKSNPKYSLFVIQRG